MQRSHLPASLIAVLALAIASSQAHRQIGPAFADDVAAASFNSMWNQTCSSAA